MPPSLRLRLPRVSMTWLSTEREEDKAAAKALVDQANGALMEVESYLSEPVPYGSC